MSENSTESTALKAIYRGPEMHERILTRQDLVNGQFVDDESELPENFEQLRWGAYTERRWVKLEGMPEGVVDMLKADPSFEVRTMGEGSTEVGEHAPDAARVNAAGGSPGIPENKELADAIGWEPEPEEDLAPEEGGSPGQEQSFASASGDGDTVTTGGSSTA